MTITKIDHRNENGNHATYIKMDGKEYELLITVQSPLLVRAGLFDVYLDFITALHNAGLRDAIGKDLGIFPPQSMGIINNNKA